ncbi:methyltransferase domain-containing protein [bacterium]|nr:methyltransferase domain-containing protein [bacterium]
MSSSSKMEASRCELPGGCNPLTQKIAEYWNERIHDLAVAKHPAGTAGFFEDLAEYRFDKLNYLQSCVDFTRFKGKKVLEIGCGAGIDAVLFAENGADYTGVDLSGTAIALAEKNFGFRDLKGAFRVMDGEEMDFPDETFDAVYAHGVLQYAADAGRMVREAFRVLKPGGEFIAMVYNRDGWLNKMSRFFKVELEHQDAPVLNMYSIREFREILAPFERITMVPERFPVRSKLHHGLKGFLYNTFFVGTFNAIPRPLVRKWGWHLMAFASKR